VLLQQLQAQVLGHRQFSGSCAALAHGAPLGARDRDFDSPPLGWAIQGSLHGWPGISAAERATCVRLLLEAGAVCPETLLPTGN
jgi:hypothetical protein